MTTAEDTRQGAAKLFHALSDPTRLEILERLRGGERCVCDLQGALDAAQSRLSFHLRTLRDAGLVSDRKEGRWVYYALRPEAIDEMARALGDLTTPRTRVIGEWYSCCG
jgi:ArsR family transcriptional regulator